MRGQILRQFRLLPWRRFRIALPNTPERRGLRTNTPLDCRLWIRGRRGRFADELGEGHSGESGGWVQRGECPEQHGGTGADTHLDQLPNMPSSGMGPNRRLHCDGGAGRRGRRKDDGAGARAGAQRAEELAVRTVWAFQAGVEDDALVPRTHGATLER